MSRVRPFGAERATSAAPTALSVPERFSTTRVWSGIRIFVEDDRPVIRHIVPPACLDWIATTVATSRRATPR